MPKLFITGIAGLVGSSLAKDALQNGWDVAGIDLIPRSSASRLNGLKLDYSWGSCQDITPKAFVGARYVVHAAAVADVPLALGSPSYTLQQNVMGTLALMQACLEAQVERVIIQSSESVYGKANGRIIETTPLSPVNIYGASKAAQEMVALSFWESYQLPVVVLRSSTLFGPGMRANQVVPIFLRKALAGEPITVHGDGKQSRDFNYISNLIDALRMVLGPEPWLEGGDIFNISGDNEISILDLAQKCIEVMGSKSTIIHLPQRVGEQDLHLVPDCHKAFVRLGYQPKVSFDEGLAIMTKHMVREAIKA